MATFNGSLLAEPWEVATKTRRVLQGFHALLARLARKSPLGRAPAHAFENAARPLARGRSTARKFGRLVSGSPKTQLGARLSRSRRWRGCATRRLELFLVENLDAYALHRDRIDLSATSGLSAHLHFGEISPRQIFAEAARKPGADKFLSEIGWREFSTHLLYAHPDLACRNFNPRFDAFPWRRDDKALRAWQRGQTGYPLVDAGMRELWQTGVMHNRARMVCASFLTKHLLIDWREGEAWFWDTLIDADAPIMRRAGNGWPAAAPTPRPISAFSIRYCRARNSIPRRLCPPLLSGAFRPPGEISSIGLGPRRRQCWPRLASCWAKTTQPRLSIMISPAAAPLKLSPLCRPDRRGPCRP